MPTPDICWMTFEYVSIYVIIDLLRIGGHSRHANEVRKYHVARRPLDVLFNYASVGVS